MGRDIIRHADGTVEEHYESDAPLILRAARWPMVVATLSAGFFGGVSFGGAGSHTKTIPVVVTIPATPTIDALVLNDSTVVLTTTAFSGSGQDTHDKTVWQVDELAGDWSTLVALDTTFSGASLTLDTIMPLDSGVALKARAKHVGTTGGSSLFSDSVAFTPVAAPTPSFAREPAGMSVIYDFDGTVAKPPAYTGNIIYTTPGNWTANVVSVPVTGDPRGTGFALAHVTPIGTRVPGTARSQAFPAGPVDTMYWRVDIKFSTNYETSTGGVKITYLASDSATRSPSQGANGPTQFYVTREPNGSSRFTTQNGASERVTQTGAGVLSLGVWHTIECVATSETAVGVADGTLSCWWDGVPGGPGNGAYTSGSPQSGVDWNTSSKNPTNRTFFNGMQWHMYNSNAVNTVQDTVWTQLYISGK